MNKLKSHIIQKEYDFQKVMKFLLKMQTLIIASHKVFKESCKLAIEMCQFFIECMGIFKDKFWEHFHEDLEDFLDVIIDLKKEFQSFKK